MNERKVLSLCFSMLFLVVVFSSCTAAKSASKAKEELPLQPLTFTQVFGRRNANFNDPSLIPEGARITASITVPQLNNPHDPRAKALNACFAGTAQQLMQKVPESLGTPGLKEGAQLVLDWNYTIARNDANYLSVVRTGSISVDGVASSQFTQTDNFRLYQASATPLTLTDVLSLSYEQIPSVLMDKVEIFSGGDFDKNDPLKYFNFDTFTIAPGGLVLYYPTDSNDPHSVRACEIPFSELPDILVDQTITEDRR